MGETLQLVEMSKNRFDSLSTISLEIVEIDRLPRGLLGFVCSWDFGRFFTQSLVMTIFGMLTVAAENENDNKFIWLFFTLVNSAATLIILPCISNISTIHNPYPGTFIKHDNFLLIWAS